MALLLLFLFGGRGWGYPCRRNEEKMGQLTNHTDLKAEGVGEKIGAKIRKKIGPLEKVAERPRTFAASRERAVTTLRFRPRN
jgi:hypothetical protein